MPMIELTTTKGALDPDATQRLAGELSTIALELEAAPLDFGDAEHMQALAWCFVNEQDVYVGGQALPKPIYRVVVTIPEGAPGIFGPLAARNREQLVKRVTAAVLAAEGTPDTMVEAHRVWVQLRSVANGHWGGFGEVVTVADLAAYGFGRGGPRTKVGRMREAALESVGAGTTSPHSTTGVG
jgi:phenylpyruvate tautomerase PptA (4-oxalocrotonate tautomerase family)